MSTGKTVPQITFKYRVRDASIGGDNPFRWQDVTSDEIFRDKKVVVFSLPGAFTPTCSTQQVPGFEAAYEEFIKLGID
ncbi:MAG: redoxin family protein, partial [Oceanospirillaceae bacterium]|nr:redoxin family protein [Oceanospirillaceae bacterium]